MPEGLEIKEGPLRARRVRHARVRQGRRGRVTARRSSCPATRSSASSATTSSARTRTRTRSSSCSATACSTTTPTRPNCEYIQDGPRVITFVTLRDVEAGEELTIDYGEEWWSTRNLEPDR